MPKFIMIVGPQAVGKMTVGQELSKITKYRQLLLVQISIY